ncbi:GntR family transcriptional regulator [Pseudonocardia acaciae]|uniref:GntR family transcriptional regulator n=1 Tax=Pseudonocardia acaciae TaxID=551276 RepID=UPI0004917481|nr:GntR family transcriptional regulator [Pseudonocardia acaciae]
MKITRVYAPVREQVVEVIRAEIVNGDLRPGQRLVEREVCERLDISRNTLREALRQLEAEGFVTIAPNRGPAVAVLTADEARQVYQVREALECMAVRLFVERSDSSDRDKLRDVVARLRDAHTTGSVTTMLDAKTGFYDVLYAGCGNDVLRGQAALLQSRLYQLRARSLSRPGRPIDSIAEIEQVLELIASGDAAGAAELWSRHIRGAAAAALADNTDNMTESGGRQ